MHLFLTGPIRIGRTTVVDKTIDLLGVTPGGFRSYFGPDRPLPEHFLYMSSADAPRSCTPQHAIVAFRAQPNGDPQCTVLPRFEELGLACLQTAPRPPPHRAG